MDGQQQDKPDDIETAKRERHDLGLRIVEFVLGHIAKTGDNPAAEKAQSLLDELRKVETQG